MLKKHLMSVDSQITDFLCSSSVNICSVWQQQQQQQTQELEARSRRLKIISITILDFFKAACMWSLVVVIGLSVFVFFCLAKKP